MGDELTYAEYAFLAEQPPPLPRRQPGDPVYEEDKHPRDATGKWAKKPGMKIGRGPVPKKVLDEETTPASPELQSIADATVAFLNGVNIPTGPMRVLIGSDEMFGGAVSSIDGNESIAYHDPGAMILNPKYLAQWSNLATLRSKGTMPSTPDFSMAILHEALHEVRASTGYNPDNAGLEEGLVESTTIDLGQLYARSVYGPKAARLWTYWNMGQTKTSYRDQVVEVRKRSMRATGKPWHSPEAFAWRVSMLRMSYDERAAEWARVETLPLPTFKHPAVRQNPSLPPKIGKKLGLAEETFLSFVEVQHPRGRGGKWVKKSSTLYKNLIDGNGFTYQPFGGMEPHTGYSVSARPEEEFHRPAEEINSDDVRAFLEKHADLWQTDPSAHLGGWVDQDEETGRTTAYLDIATVKDDRIEAERLGNLNAQYAIADLAAIAKADWTHAFIDLGSKREIDRNRRIATIEGLNASEASIPSWDEFRRSLSADESGGVQDEEGLAEASSGEDGHLNLGPFARLRAWEERLHPRGRGGRFRDKPDVPTLKVSSNDLDARLQRAQEKADAAFKRFMEDPSPGRKAAATRAARELEEAQADKDFGPPTAKLTSFNGKYIEWEEHFPPGDRRYNWGSPPSWWRSSDRRFELRRLDDPNNKDQATDWQLTDHLTKEEYHFGTDGDARGFATTLPDPEDIRTDPVRPMPNQLPLRKRWPRGKFTTPFKWPLPKKYQGDDYWLQHAVDDATPETLRKWADEIEMTAKEKKAHPEVEDLAPVLREIARKKQEAIDRALPTVKQMLEHSFREYGGDIFGWTQPKRVWPNTAKGKGFPVEFVTSWLSERLGGLQSHSREVEYGVGDIGAYGQKSMTCDQIDINISSVLRDIGDTMPPEPFIASLLLHEATHTFSSLTTHETPGGESMRRDGEWYMSEEGQLWEEGIVELTNQWLLNDFARHLHDVGWISDEGMRLLPATGESSLLQQMQDIREERAGNVPPIHRYGYLVDRQFEIAAILGMQPDEYAAWTLPMPVRERQPNVLKKLNEGWLDNSLSLDDFVRGMALAGGDPEDLPDKTLHQLELVVPEVRRPYGIDNWLKNEIMDTPVGDQRPTLQHQEGIGTRAVPERNPEKEKSVREAQDALSGNPWDSGQASDLKKLSREGYWQSVGGFTVSDYLADPPRQVVPRIEAALEWWRGELVRGSISKDEFGKTPVFDLLRRYRERKWRSG